MARGIYEDTGAYTDDYALRRDHRRRWRVDRIGRNGTHTTLGRATGEESKTAAAHLAQSDARARGTYSAAVFLVNDDGSLTQIGNVVYGRYQVSGDRSRRASRRDSTRSALRSGDRAIVHGQKAIVREYFPRGSTSYMFPHYKVDFVNGDRNVAVAVNYVQPYGGKRF